MSELLRKGQYQIGTILFGDSTNMPVSKVEIQPWNVNNEDFQIIHSDETRFGLDNLTPAPIVFTMAVLNNWELNNVPGSNGSVPPGLLYQSRTLLGQLTEAWKATTTRQTWGAMVALIFVDADGIRRRVYGRPGKFQHGPVEQNEWVDVQAEFRRADTMAYADNEMVIEIGYNDDPTYIFRDQGDAPAWFRLIFYGPLINPQVTIGKCTVQLDLEIPSDAIVEVSSYPWMRRIIDSNGFNWRASLIGQSQYLDQLTIPPNEEIALRWTDDTMTTWTSLDSNDQPINYDFLSMFNYPVINAGWHALMGTAIWGFSLNTGGYLWAPFGTAAIIDNVHQYKTNGQFVQATIADMWAGSSTIIFKSTANMSNFAGAQIVKTVTGNSTVTGNDKLRIVTGGLGTSYNILDEYDVPSPGLETGDTVACAYDPTTDMLYLEWNGEEVGSASAGVTVTNNTTTNVYQGFVMNMDDSITDLQFGVGLNNTIAYDASFQEPGPPSNPNDLESRVFLYWREAWHIE